MAYTCAVDTTQGYVQLQLPTAYWDWRAKTPLSTLDAMALVSTNPKHPSLQPPDKGRRVFAVYDGGGEGDGVPCGQLSLIPS